MSHKLLKNVIIASLTAVCALFGVAHAGASGAEAGSDGASRWGGVALTAKAGTLGAGLDLTKGLTDTLNLRAGVNGYSYDYSGVESGIDYSLDLDLRTVSLLADWHPINGGFRITGGVFYNGNELNGAGRPAAGGIYDIDGTTYTATEVGTLSAAVDFSSVAPYLGVGWGNAIDTRGRWHVSLDAGVLFQGSPEARLSADGSLASDPAFQSDLMREQASLQDEIDEFKYYPVFSVGVSYRF